MQNSEVDFSDLEDLTMNEIKSRLALMGAEMDFQKHPKDFYKKKYMELIRDPNNKLILRRYGVIKNREPGYEDEQLTNKKRLRGKFYIENR
jgi:hypothetical protein